MTDTFGASLGQLIRSQRERQGMTQAELSKAVEITPVALSRMENGKVANPRESTLDKLLNALDIERGELELLRSGEPVEDTAKRIDQRRNRDIKRELVTTDLRAHLNALEAGEFVSLDIMKELASAFGGDVETLGNDLESFLSSKAKEYQALRKEVEAIDDGLKRLSNLKAAAQGAIKRVDLDEVEELLSRVQEVELEEAARTAELRADNALLRGRVDQAFSLLNAAAHSFAAIDPLEPARRHLQYEDKLFQHGFRYGGNGIKLSATMVRSALADTSRREAPELWARAKNALAISLRAQGTRTEGAIGTALLAEAVIAYREALEVRTKLHHPIQWAETTQNLAGALATQGTRTQGEAGTTLLAEAAIAYREALTVTIKADFPFDWAMTTQNLAAALQIQGTRTEGEAGIALLAEAVIAYRDALTVRTKAQYPAQWASTTQNLANALSIQGERTEGPAGTALLADAANSYREALEVTKKADNPVGWAMTTQNLASALATQGSRTLGEAGTTLLEEAVNTYRDALTVRTKSGHPVDWAMTQVNLAVAEKDIATHDATDDTRPNLQAALEHVDSALTIYDPEHMSYDHTVATELRTDILAKLDALPKSPT